MMTTYTETGFGAFFNRVFADGTHEYAQPATDATGQDLLVMYHFTASEIEEATDLDQLPWDDAHRDRVMDATTGDLAADTHAGR